MPPNQYLTATEFKQFGIAAAALAQYDDPAIDFFLVTASDVADSYIRSKYVLPLVTWGSDLKLAVAQIAVLLILNHRGFDPENPPGSAIIADQTARKWLADVSAGRANLQIVETAPTARVDAVVYSRPQRGWGWGRM